MQTPSLRKGYLIAKQKTLRRSSGIMASQDGEVKSQEYGTKDNDTPGTFSSLGKRYYVVRKRWAVLTLASSVMFLNMFSFSFFSVINDQTSLYFGIEPAVADLQATMNLGGRMVCPVIIFLYADWVSFRRIVILGAALNTVGALLVFIGILVATFGCLVAGMFLNGCATTMLLSLSQQTAVMWFPLQEWGKVNGVVWAARRLSVLISSLISTRSTGVTYSFYQLENLTSSSYATRDLDFKFRLAFSSVFGVVAFLSLVCCIAAQLFLSERPPIFAEDQSVEIASENRSLLGKVPSYSCKKELRDLGKVMTNRSLILIVAVFSLAMADRPLGSTVISSLILNVFQQLNDEYVGVMLCLGYVVACITSLLAGQVLDRFSRPRLTFIFVVVFWIVADVLFSICFFTVNMTGSFVAFFMLWCTRDVFLVCLNHRLTAIGAKFPSSVQVKAYSLAVGGAALCTAVSTTVIRYVMDNVNSSVAVLCPMPFLLICLFCYIFLWSYLRDAQ